MVVNLLVKNMIFFSFLTASNYKSGRLREVCISGHTVVLDAHKGGIKATGWMTLVSSMSR